MVEQERTKSEFLSIQNELKTIANGIENNLVEILSDKNNIDRVQSRTKGTDSFLKKALKEIDGRLKYQTPLKEIQDLIGARIVVYYKSDVDVVKEIIQNFYRSVEVTSLIPDDATKFGYEGFHMVCFIPNFIFSDHKQNPLIPDFFELQIKTLYQHAWSQANHGLGYKSKSELTFDQERKLAFIAAQSWGADKILSEF